jgi:hypothetical protein
MAKIRSNLGNVYRTQKAARFWARGRPIKKVKGGYKIMAKRKKKRKKRRRSTRKTYKKKSTAKNKAGKGRSVYKVKGGWRIGRR